MSNIKKGLDEMQLQRRNSIGNQMFMIMTYLMFINIGLHSFEVTWIEYPVSTMLIVVACLSIYLIRLIASNAYLPTAEQSSKTRLIIVLVTSIVVAFGISAFIFFRQSPVETTETSHGHGAVVLMIASSAGLLIAFVVAVINKFRNKDEVDD